ncbi:PREDICTED: zinc finger CCCH domain-containing protein 66-like [Tarenaya hassleriana]|uniref:zinc finger CCCH domain-containing protein 66-like n=1 Tax=Tarenaya hassleriana TaxID=28532 RepID=UPI00053C5B42|nr:PREDICTED: zinc finger CCCH domain-containing protein 66-like [Tarenaya hassleriana]XP_010541454.1 PREDICTED: zinc finger CCCH domain-containing protein 66-like [Tarenaya hassleriana]XP_019058247.1 PREDICTED: zinc finger CCCH domain-containing protein 66-like [Tarenaya hassleriana]
MGEAELPHLELSLLLELSACNDLNGFISLLEQEGLDNIDRSSSWYGRRIGSREMGFDARTPLMIASLFGSKEMVDYIIRSGRVDINRSCGSDAATALHCAVSGFSANSPDVVSLLLNAGADANSPDANGNKPVDVIFPSLNPVFSSRKKILERLLNGGHDLMELEDRDEQREASEKKEYPVDPTLPDINSGIYGTDEFRMYAFKIKPCSRAYSHDWTECPFVHPGENARRRDPRKYQYSCVPCPEFRKGYCCRGDSCEYAHGIFECWLHPSQYRTRLCKDEMNCKRRVCFFAHKPEELRPLYPSTGSGVPSPRSSFSSCNSAYSFDNGPISPLGFGSSTTPPLSPNTVPSPIGGKTWVNFPNIVPPTLQLPRSRLKSTINAKEIDFSDAILGLSSPTPWNTTAMSSASSPLSGDIKATSLNKLAGGTNQTSLSDVFGPDDTSGLQIRRSSAFNPQLYSSYATSNSLTTSPIGAKSSSQRDLPASGEDAFAKRSQSFMDLSCHSAIPSAISTCMDDWGSPDGKLDWSVHGDDMQKFGRSASFGFRVGGGTRQLAEPVGLDEPDVSWVDPLVKEPSEMRLGRVWMEQSFMETEQSVA